mgnify:CR=1 FL=1
MKFETIHEVIKSLFMMVVSFTFFLGAINSMIDDGIRVKENFSKLYVVLAVISALAFVIYGAELLKIFF